MAYLDDDEIIATIRHEMRIEDEDGRCNDVLPPVFRRAKYGGLPLDFRSMKRSDEDEDGRQSPGYTIPIEEVISSTRDLITSRLRSRTADSDQLRDEFEARAAADATAPRDDHIDLFIERPAMEVLRVARQRRESTAASSVSRLLDEESISIPDGPDTPFRVYSSFEADESSTDAFKSILIVYAIPEADNAPGPRPLTITIKAKCSARVVDVSGLACLKFVQMTGIAPSCSPEHMQLYMAEESGEIDDDFPPLDTHKEIGDFGFTVLALKANSSNNKQSSSLTVIVYIPDKDHTKFIFELDHLRHTLRWLRDRTVARRLDTMSDAQKAAFTMIPHYNLEHVDKPDVPLDLDKSIASAATTEFVLVRKNSSRDGFHPRGGLPQDVPPPTPGPKSGMGFDFPMAVSASVRPLSMNLDEEIIASFTVDRLHKYKPKWPAHLVIRWNWIEITPVQTDRRLSNRFQGSGQKQNVIAWEDLADAKIREKRNPSGGLPIVQVSITWLPPVGAPPTPTTPLRKSSTMIFDLPSSGGGSNTVRDIAVRYKDNDKWKVLNLEMASYSDAERAVRQLTDGIKQSNSAVSQVFTHSKGGDIRPGASAEAAIAFQLELSAPLPRPTHQRKRSSIMNIQPLQRFLSRNT